MAPSLRLIRIGAAVLALAALLAFLDPAFSAAPLGAALLLAVAAVTDRARSAEDAAGIRVLCPAELRMSRTHAASFSVALRNAPAGRLVEILPQAVPGLTLQPATRQAHGDAPVAFSATGERRGLHLIPGFLLRLPSRWGLWDVQHVVPQEVAVRVYPELDRERRQLAGLFLRNAAGGQVRRLLGRGREFDQLREHAPGDGMDEIHWRATAKRGRPVTKMYRAERTQEIYVVVDASRLSARPVDEDGDPGDTFLERSVRAALVLCLAAQKEGDLTGLVTFSDRMHTFLRARGGRGHYLALRDQLYTLAPRRVSPDFGDVCTALRVRLRRRALILWLTHLDDPVLAEEFERQVAPVRRQHLVVALTPRPAGAVPLLTGEPPADRHEVLARIAGHLQWRDLWLLTRRLARLGVHLTQVDEGRYAAGAVNRYLEIKKRQAL